MTSITVIKSLGTLLQSWRSNNSFQTNRKHKTGSHEPAMAAEHKWPYRKTKLSSDPTTEPKDWGSLHSGGALHKEPTLSHRTRTGTAILRNTQPGHNDDANHAIGGSRQLKWPHPFQRNKRKSWSWQCPCLSSEFWACETHTAKDWHRGLKRAACARGQGWQAGKCRRSHRGSLWRGPWQGVPADAPQVEMWTSSYRTATQLQTAASQTLSSTFSMPSGPASSPRQSPTPVIDYSTQWEYHKQARTYKKQIIRQPFVCTTKSATSYGYTTKSAYPFDPIQNLPTLWVPTAMATNKTNLNNNNKRNSPIQNKYKYWTNNENNANIVSNLKNHNIMINK